MRLISDIFRSHAVFDEHGRHTNGTDKESNHHYGDAYEWLFTLRSEVRNSNTRTKHNPCAYFCVECGSDYDFHYPCCSKAQYTSRSTRDEIRLVMEVGVADGACLRAWREVFPNATVVGMDIHPSSLAHGERIEFHLGDQRSQVDCDRAAAGRYFDMIVDDATHQLEDTLRTMLYLWPRVKPGGLYVVEEFPNVGALRSNIVSMWPWAEIIDTVGPFGGVEPLVAIRRPT